MTLLLGEFDARAGVMPWLTDNRWREMKDDLGDAGYEASTVNGYGDQGTFDVLTDGSTSRGLRVTVERGTHRISAETNGFTISVTVENALSVSLTSAMRTVTIELAAATTMAQLKAAVDAVGGLNSVYFGGENGTGATDAQTVPPISNATKDFDIVYRVRCSAPMHVYCGTAAPTNDNQTVIANQGSEFRGILPAGLQIWTKRQGNTDVIGSIEGWPNMPPSQ